MEPAKIRAASRRAPYVRAVGDYRGTPEEEAARQWMIAEWLLGAVLPACLDAAGAGNLALDLESSAVIRTQRDLTTTASLVEEAARAARHAHESWREATASLAGPSASYQVNTPVWRATSASIPAARASAWQGLCGGATAAVEPVDALVSPVATILGIGPDDGSHAWASLRSAPSAVRNCLLAVAWSGCYRRVAAGAWSWSVDPERAARVGRSAGSRALRPLHPRLDHLARDLAWRLVAVTMPRQVRQRPAEVADITRQGHGPL